MSTAHENTMIVKIALLFGLIGVELAFGKHWIIIGSNGWETSSSGDKPAECTYDTAITGVGSNSFGNEIGVQCCSLDGTKAYRQHLHEGIKYSGFTGCLKGVSYDVALSACQFSGYRLCTVQEVSSNIGAGTGCNHDARHVWTSGNCLDDGSSEFLFIEQKMCDNLNEMIQIKYDLTLSECIDECQGLNISCTMFNYLTYLKSVSDSRCYIFDKLCDVKVGENANNSIIGYKIYDEKCIDYPLDWRDKVGDSCYLYYDNSIGWCMEQNISRNESEFMELRDTKYGLTAIDTCCKCGGGVYEFDNIKLRYYDKDNDNTLCKYVECDFALTPNNDMVKEWDNLMLFSLCNKLNNIDCMYLIDRNFESDSYLYSLSICYANDYRQIPFIFDVIINDINQTHTTYINKFWFNLNLLYYSSNINVEYMHYSQCIDGMRISYSFINNTSNKYGVDPCCLLNNSNNSNIQIPTLIPTSHPTPISIISSSPSHIVMVTENITLSDGKTTNHPTITTIKTSKINQGIDVTIWIIIILALIIVLILIVVIIFYFKKFKKSEKNINHIRLDQVDAMNDNEGIENKSNSNNQTNIINSTQMTVIKTENNLKANILLKDA